jgi:hypothetical protein
MAFIPAFLTLLTLTHDEHRVKGELKEGGGNMQSLSCTFGEVAPKAVPSLQTMFEGKSST